MPFKTPTRADFTKHNRKINTKGLLRYSTFSTSSPLFLRCSHARTLFPSPPPTSASFFLVVGGLEGTLRPQGGSGPGGRSSRRGHGRPDRPGPAARLAGGVVPRLVQRSIVRHDPGVDRSEESQVCRVQVRGRCEEFPPLRSITCVRNWGGRGGGEEASERETEEATSEKKRCGGRGGRGGRGGGTGCC